MSSTGDFQPSKKVMIHMEDEQDGELQIPSGLLTGINFSVSTQQDTENIAVITIDAAGEVSDPKLGLPNPSYQCSTCGASVLKCCEGHFGVIKFPYTIIHPYFLSEVAQVLNKVCPGCKSIRQELWGKVSFGFRVKYSGYLKHSGHMAPTKLVIRTELKLAAYQAGFYSWQRVAVVRILTH